jgi:hypothetical protein
MEINYLNAQQTPEIILLRIAFIVLQILRRKI